MVEFDCGRCDIVLERTVQTDVLEEPGPYPVQQLACPSCGTSWKQRSTGALVQVLP
jgi:hypothetical protein